MKHYRQVRAVAALRPGSGQRGLHLGRLCCVPLAEPDVKLVGPSLAGVATRAATRRPGYRPEIYIYQSITPPDAYRVEGFQLLMPKDFKLRLTPQHLAEVVAF